MNTIDRATARWRSGVKSMRMRSMSCGVKEWVARAIIDAEPTLVVRGDVDEPRSLELPAEDTVRQRASNSAGPGIWIGHDPGGVVGSTSVRKADNAPACPVRLVS